jgi:hypothetical protein
MILPAPSRWRAVLAGLTSAALAGAMVTSLPASAAAAADPLVLDRGHIDAFNVSVSNGESRVRLPGMCCP